MRATVNGVRRELEPSGAEVIFDGDRMLVRSGRGTASAAAVRVGDTVLVSYRGRTYRVGPDRPARKSGGEAGSGEIRAPMPGVIADVTVEEGASVRKGQKLVVLEAMKTQQPFSAAFDGTVERVNVSKGQQVQEGTLLVSVGRRGENV